MKLQWDLQRISRACAAADVLSAMFRRDPGEAGPSAPIVIAEGENRSPISLGPDAPIFARFLLDEAIEQGVGSPQLLKQLEDDYIPSEEDEEVEEEDNDENKKEE
ncbi:hypothetical protein GGS20DRAFT_587648 [Poronia punctata]|nr:hypothetical protein GGS20DRAFT_587648 [Poronia punctata]